MIGGLLVSPESALRSEAWVRCFTSGAINSQRRQRQKCGAEGSNDAISERLKAVQEEAKELRKQLEAARATKGQSTEVSNHIPAPMVLSLQA